MSHIVDEQKPHVGGAWLNCDPNAHDEAVFNKIIDALSVKTMVSIGCGQGFCIKHFMDQGVECLGIDGSQTTIDMAVCPKEKIILHDYTEGVIQLDKIYDLGLCVEFVEHIYEQYAPNFIHTFKQCKFIAVTHAVPDQSGYHHVNLQESKYWIDLLTKNGFYYMQGLSKQLREMTTAIHLNRNLMIFANTSIKV